MELFFRLMEKAAEGQWIILFLTVMFVHCFTGTFDIPSWLWGQGLGGQDSPATGVVLDNKERRSEKYKGHLQFSHFNCGCFNIYTANEEPVRIQYKCLLPIYVFPEMKLCTVQPRYFKNIIIMFCLQIPVRDLYISSISLSTLLQAKYVDRSWEYINHSQTHGCRNWTETAQFLLWEYIT